MADVVKKVFKRGEFMIPEQAYQDVPQPKKECCGRCKKVRESDARRIAKIKVVKK